MESLLLYSSVCGCGPDMIPLPQDISEEEITSIILDTTALAFMLNKPLITRLVPIPGKTSEDKTEFDYHFFYNTKLMGKKGLTAKKLLKNNESFGFMLE